MMKFKKRFFIANSNRIYFERASQSKQTQMEIGNRNTLSIRSRNTKQMLLFK